MKWREIHNRDNPGNVPEDWPPKADPDKIPPEVKRKQEEMKKAHEEAEAKRKAEEEANPPQVEEVEEAAPA